MAVYDRDYLTTLPLLYDKAYEYSNGDWNKYNDDVGDTMLKLLASASHSVDYYFRMFLNTLFLPNDDWNMKSLIWELTGYKPNYLRADYLMVQLYWPDCGLQSYVPLPQYTPFKIVADDKEYIFLCAQDYYIPPRTTRFNVRLVNGGLHILNLVPDKITNNKVKLSDYDIDYDLVTLKVSGEKWTQVRNVFYAVDTNKIFSLHKEEDGTYLYLHKSWSEQIDSYDPSIDIYFVESFYDFDMYTDDCMSVSFETELFTIDGEDISGYYKIIPLLNSDEALSANILMPSTTEGNRAITTLDYESNAKLFPGIVACKAYDWNTTAVCTTPFEVVVIACDKQGNLSEHMKIVLKSYLESIGSPLINVKMVEPIQAVQDLLVVLDIGEYRGTLAERQLKSIAEDAVKEFYAIGNLPPGRVVKANELNSAIMRADSRIYFASTTFFNRLPADPRLIPVLGTLIVITSASTYNYYDWGFAEEHAYIGNRRFDIGLGTDKLDSMVAFFRDTAHGNELSPIDKLPLELFDSGTVSFSHPVFALGTGEASPADWGFGEEFVYTVKTGGDPSLGPVYAVVYETDGNSVLGTFESAITNICISSLSFTNSGGTVIVDPGITTLPGLTDDDVVSIKAALAAAFNAIPGLVDAMGQPFEITGDDISYGDPIDGGTTPSDPVLLGISHVTSKQAGLDATIDKSTVQSKNAVLGAPGDLFKAITVRDLSVASAGHAVSGIINRIVNTGESVIQEERSFVYIPYQNALLYDRSNYTERSRVQKINFKLKTMEQVTPQTFPDMSYGDGHTVGRIDNNFGVIDFTAEVDTTRTTTYNELVATEPEIYDDIVSLDKLYYVHSKLGSSLNWYFVSTTSLRDVNSTTFIGTGINVYFSIQCDTTFYVEIDEDTTRGFIYSSELVPEQLNITDDITSLVH